MSHGKAIALVRSWSLSLRNLTVWLLQRLEMKFVLKTLGKYCCISQCFTKDPSGREHRQLILLEIHSAPKLISEIRKTNSEQMETRMYCLEKKYRMIMVPKAEHF